MEGGEAFPQLSYDLDDALDFALVLRRRRTGGVGDDIVVIAELGEGPVERGIVDIRDDDARLQVVEVDPRGAAAVVRERRGDGLGEGNLVLVRPEEDEGQSRIR